LSLSLSVSFSLSWPLSPTTSAEIKRSAVPQSAGESKDIVFSRSSVVHNEREREEEAEKERRTDRECGGGRESEKETYRKRENE
jgi:hypothetical protein